MKSSEHLILTILRWATVCIFLGRGWLHLFWEVPYGTICWDEAWMKGIAHGIGMSWVDWQDSPTVSAVLLGMQRIIGIVYVCLALMTAFLRSSHSKSLGRLLWLGSFFLFLLAVVSWKSHSYQWPQLWEHTAQFTIPLFFYLCLYQPPSRRYQWWMRIAIAITFTCHGLFAIGWPYPTPDNFLEMSMNILPIEEDLAYRFLHVAGYVDLLVSVVIFFPTSGRTALVYAIAWGSLTALARVVAYVDGVDTLMDLHRWLPETVLRAPHALLPLAVWFIKTRAKT